MRILSSTLLLAVLPALTAQTPPTAPAAVQAAPAAKAPKLDAQLYDHFGDGIAEGPWVEVAAMLQAPDQHVGKTVRLRGPITAICQTKGCWMHLNSEAQPVMVKFKDYGFFMPKDASGRTAIVEGTLSLKQETVEQTRHYLEDAGKTEEAKKITEGRKIYTFMANGVAIRKRAAKLDSKLYDHFGDGILEGPTTAVDAVKADPTTFVGRTLRLRGAITAVCQTKGCWMHLGSEAAPVMVKFKDYAFFVPKDASGRAAVVEGTLTLRQETVEQTRHYLEDAGKTEEAKKVTEGRKILFFMASGVAIEKTGG